MLAFVFAPFYILVNLYLAGWVLRWAKSLHSALGGTAFRVIFSALYAFFALTPLTGFLIKNPAGLHRLLSRIGNYWLGWLLYLGLGVAAGELVLLGVCRARHKKREQMRRAQRIQGGCVLALTCAVCFYGMAHAHTLQVTDHTVQVDKAGGDMTVALLADLHLGYSTDPADIERAVRTVNEMQPDLVVLAGDVFDNAFDAVHEPERIASALASIQSRFGVYACWGNHDLAEPILAGFTFGGGGDRRDPRMEELLETAGVTLLEDETALLPNGVQLVGRRDPARSRKLREPRLTPEELTRGLDLSRPVFVIDHQPRQLAELAAAGVDLDLSGHTHDGQVFPANLTVRLAWENACGYLRVGDMHSVVTSGLGVWGPAMRVGTKSEIVRINVRFTG